ncbi:MAG: 2OG-Fe(II) oxygenase family protein [Hyphomonadaceae bacterium]
MKAELRINEALDAVALGKQLQANRRLQIENFLPPASAEELYALLRSNTDWFVAYNKGAEGFDVPLADMQALPAEERQRFYQNVNKRAAVQFQYCFLQYYITESKRRGDNPGHPLHVVDDFVNGADWLAFMRTLTGEPAVCAADALASRYSAGHFLTDHSDAHARHDRVAAFVISLTKDWNRNWGGHLVFFDEHGNIEQGFAPRFNTLNIFLVPQAHAVQAVTPFAAGARTSITGWLHRTPPGA